MFNGANPIGDSLIVIVTFETVQFVGSFTSQISYGITKVPPGVPGATSTEPSALNVIPAGIVPSGEKFTVTCPGLIG